MIEQNGDIKLPPPGGEPQLTKDQRSGFMKRAGALLPPLEMLELDELDEYSSIEARYRVGDKIVIIRGRAEPTSEEYDWIEVSTQERISSAPDGLFFVTRGRSYSIGDPDQYDNVYEERVDVWERRGIRMDNILKAGALYRNRQAELKAFVEEVQYFEKGSIADHYDEVMAVLEQCGPDNFIVPPPPGSVILI